MNKQQMYEKAAEEARGCTKTRAQGPDATLIMRARSRINAANVHDVICIIAHIENTYALFEMGETTEEESKRWDSWLVRDRKYLMHFLKTGDVPNVHNNYCGLGNS